MILACTLSSAFGFHMPSAMPSAPAVRRAAAPAMAGGVNFPELDGSEVRVGIIRARWHPEIIDSLIDGAKEALKESGVKEENIIETEVPGAFELPLACRYLALSGAVDAVVPVGVLIKGETTHFEVISESVTSGIMNVGLQTGIPCIFGVLTAMNNDQAVARSTGANNHGIQWGKAAVEMALVRKSALQKQSTKQFMGFGEDAAPKPDNKPKTRIGF